MPWILELDEGLMECQQEELVADTPEECRYIGCPTKRRGCKNCLSKPDAHRGGVLQTIVSDSFGSK